MPLPFVAAGLYSFVVAVVGKFLTDSLLRYVATKALLVTLMTVTLPVILKNLVTWLFETVSSVASSAISSGDMGQAVISLSGYAGYLGSHLMLADCVSVLLVAVSIRFVLNMIPFVG